MLSHDNFMANSMMHIANLGLHEAAVHLHVSPMFHVAGGARLFSCDCRGCNARRARSVRSGSVSIRDRTLQGDRNGGGAHGAESSGRPSRPRSLRLVESPTTQLWRVADAGSAAEACHAAAAGHRVPAVVRNDRTVAGRDDADAALPHVRRSECRLHTLGRAGGLQRRRRDRRCRRSTGADGQHRRDLRARTDGDAGLLATAGVDRTKRCATAGCTRATPATSTSAASCSWSIASKT